MLGDALLKWYDIAPQETPVPLAIRALARRCLRDASKAGTLGVEDGLGFVILHRCGADFYFLLVWHVAQRERALGVGLGQVRPEPTSSSIRGGDRRDPPADVLRVGAGRGRA